MLHLSLYKGIAVRAALIAALIIGAMGLFLMSGGPGEGQEVVTCPDTVTVANTECIKFPEHGSGTVAAYIATDPEMEIVTWTITEGTDLARFSIDAATGVLTFKTPPDYEAPADADTNNIYNVTIAATDSRSVPALDPATGRARPVTRALAIIVTNEDEPGEVTLGTLQPQVDTEISATLTDPDGKIRADDGTQADALKDLTNETATTKWQWARSSRATGPWTDIKDDEDTPDVEGKESDYTPTAKDLEMYLRATATYDDGQDEDGQGEDKTAHAVSFFPVQPDPVNKRPIFKDEEGETITTTTRSVAENSDAGTAVGAPVAATDIGADGRQETLTYGLSGTGDDADSFNIDSRTGQITVKGDLDHDTETDGKSSYSLSVTATDPSNLSATIPVRVTVTNVDEAPTIEAATQSTGQTSVQVEENTPADEEVSSYTATDPDGDDAGSLKWTLSGQDAGSFWIGNFSDPDERGKLYFRDSPNYEAPTDSGRNNVYEVTVEVTDRGGNKATRDVTVSVRNLDEDGLLTVSNRTPQVGNRIIATLTDPDSPITNVRWTWTVSGTADGRTDTYDPKEGDAGKGLVVEVSYTDGTGTRQDEDLNLRNIGERLTGSNRSPSFPTGILSRLTVQENNTAGDEVGAPVVATDPDGSSDPLTYSMSGGDGAFAIDQVSGQISTTGVLDREKRSSYRVTVTAEDPSGARDTHSLTIEVTDFDEPPAIRAGDAPTVFYAENGRATVATYRAQDPEGSRINWSLDGDDKALFTLFNGTLRFKSAPDYEDNDYIADDGYSVEITASAGGKSDTEEITVRLINLDEPGKATLDHAPREGVAVTAVLTDPDEDVTDISWQWARSTSRSGRFVDIEDNATNAAYTPVAKDVGNYLRATATYTDGHGGGKTASVVSSDRTRHKASGPPIFLGDDGTELDTTPAIVPGTTVYATVLDTTNPEIKREIAEDARTKASVGAPVKAVDIGDNGRPERLSYKLSGTTGDDAKFEIESRNGQISLKSGFNPDFEAAAGDDNCATPNACVVTVMVRDGSGNTNTVTINIAITDVDEKPMLTLPTTPAPVGVADGALQTGFKHAEPVAAGTATTSPERRESVDDAATPPLSITFTADDPETADADNSTTLEWTLAGPDADDFVIGDNPNTPDTETAGTLTFKSGPDFEAPTDSRRRNAYDVTVQVADDGGNTSSQRVRIQVTNVGEAGSIALSHTHPEVGARLTATLTDPDEPRGRISWQWYRGTVTLATDGAVPDAASESCSDTNADASDGCSIDGAKSATYRPVTGTGDTPPDLDLNTALTVVATYRDEHGTDKVTVETTTNNVQAEDEDDRDTEDVNEGNVPPQFEDDDGASTNRYTREVREDAAAGTAVGLPVEATDGDADGADDSALVYTMAGRDAQFFTINTVSGGTVTHDGQIRVRAGTELDYESKKSYTVTVTALDPSAASATITVTINVINVDEAPVLSQKGLAAHGPGSILYDENDREAVGQYAASGVNANNVGWRLSGTDAGDFLISRDGLLTFRSSPNYESPADSDRDNVYEFTVTAASRRVSDAVDVTVEVIDVDEAGTVTLSPQRGTVGAQLSATLTDPDGGITNLDWEWERSMDGIVGWNFIPGANSASYTSISDDAGHYLRAVAYYSDGEGAGKSAIGMTAASILRDDDGVVTLDAERISVGDLVTASLTDPDGNVRNQGWRWARSESRTSGWTDIQGATASTYTPTASDVTYFLRVSVTYDDGDGVDKTAQAVSARAVAEDDDGNVALSPTSPSVGDRVTAALSDPDGGVTGQSWLWASSTDGRSNWVNITGATSATYTVAAADLGKFLRATVSYTDSMGPGKSASAITSAAVTADDDGVVTLSNPSPQVSDAITASLSDPDNTTTIPSWTWESSPNGTSGWTTVQTGQGATSTLTVSESQFGRYLRATASYSDTVGPNKSARAVTSAPVSADDDGRVTLSTNAPEVGSAVTASLSDPDNPRNLRWQWEKSVNGATWTSIDGATSSSYTPGRSDEGALLRVTVTYDDSVGSGKTEEARTSSGVSQPGLLTMYDANRNGSIERGEANRAVGDYFNGVLTREQALEVITLYFSS